MNKAKIADIKVTQRIRKEVININELAADIQRIGLINPITVMKDDIGGLRLLAGLRRLKAAQSIGWTEIDVNVVTPADAEEVLLIEINENEQRESFTYSEKMDFARLLEEIEQAKAMIRKKDGNVLGGNVAGRGRPKDDASSIGLASHDAKPIQLKTSEVVADKIGMGSRTYERAKHIRDNAPQEVIDRLDSGESSIYKEYNALRAQEKAKDEPANTTVPGTSVADDSLTTINEFDSSTGDATKINDDGDGGANIKNDDETKADVDIESVIGSNKNEATAVGCNAPQPFIDESKHLKPVSRILKPLSKEDEDAQRKINEFNALPLTKKVEVLQEQLRKERARAAEAESELKRERELHHNTKYHSELSIANLEGQVAELTTKVVELAKALGLDDK